MLKIGVFDSGVGGLSVASAIKKSIPSAEILYRDDRAHVPYGNRSPQELLGFVLPILREMVAAGCDVIVIACNTVTTTLIDQLREHITDVPLVGMEPMVKPAAAMTKTGKIVVCATPATLASERYTWLKQNYAADVSVLEPDCSNWASMIEAKQVDKHHIAVLINEAIKLDADVIILGCTHYHWIEDMIKDIVDGRAVVLQPEEPVIRQLKRVLGLIV